MTNNGGNGFRLPAPASEPRSNTRPLPELSDGGDWVLKDTEAIRSSAELRNAGGGGILSVPLSDDSPGAALVRAHELGHARWTPRNLPDKINGDFAFQLAEDCRMWQRLASSGVDCSASIAPPSEWSERIAAAPPRSYLLGVAVATAGTGDGANYQEALRAARTDAAELIDIAEAIVGRMAEAGPWPTFADTMAAADCIREVRPPEDPEDPETEAGDGEAGPDGTPGDNGSDGSGGDGSEGEGEGEGGSGGGSGGGSEGGGSEGGGGSGGGGSEGSEGGEGEGEGGGSGGSPGDARSGSIAAPSGSDPGSYSAPRPTGAERGAITRRLNREAAEAAEARAEAIEKDRDAAAERLSLAERAAGERAAAAIVEAMERYGFAPGTGGNGGPGAMEIVSVPLPIRLPARMRGTAYRSQTYGGRIGNAARVNIDGGLFRSRRMTKGGGTVLIDCSGSMDFTAQDVDAILRVAPAVTIATYNGRGRRGELRIVCQRGRRAVPSDLIPPHGGNVVDVPALEWLGRQPSRPRLWVSDGMVTGAGDSVTDAVTESCKRLCIRHGVCRVGNVSDLLALAEDPPPR